MTVENNILFVKGNLIAIIYRSDNIGGIKNSNIF